MLKHQPRETQNVYLEGGDTEEVTKFKKSLRKKEVEDEMVREHHQLNGYESEQTLEDSEGQGSLGCCSPRGRKKSD